MDLHSRSLSINLHPHQKLRGCAWTFMVTRQSTSTNLSHSVVNVQCFSMKAFFFVCQQLQLTLTGATIPPAYLNSLAGFKKALPCYKIPRMPLVCTLAPKANTNPDLAFASGNLDNRLSVPNVATPTFAYYLFGLLWLTQACTEKSKPVKHWNFYHYSFLTKKSAKPLSFSDRRQ